MKRFLTAASLFLSLCNCAAMEESVVNHAVDATGNVAGGAINKAGSKATDDAVNKADPTTSSNPSKPAPTPTAGSGSSSQQPPMVLFPDSGSYLLGVALAAPAADGSTNVMRITDGQKVMMTDFVKVRPLTPTDAKLGADVYYTTDADVRRGHFAKGSITNVASNQKVDVGAASNLDIGKQVWVAQ